jgi:hypothetical protein
MESDDRKEGVVSRWSRLKREARSVEPAVEEEAPLDGEGAEDAAEAAEPAVQPEQLPDIDSLSYESDFTVFLREGVPQELTRLALRKLWRSDPVLANLDGLNDYDLDYNKLGVDTRVAEALIKQREAKERLPGKKGPGRADDLPEPAEPRLAERPPAESPEPTAAAAGDTDSEPEDTA